MKARLLHGIYTALITLSLPFAVMRLLWKSRSRRDYRLRLSERFARQLPDTQGAIWLHTVSVGEFLATLPLIEQLLNEQQRLLITTTTPTGSAMVREKLGERVAHCYLPFDAPFLVHRFLHRVQPTAAVFIETEIWPNYLQQLHKQGIPSLLINARLSEKSYRGYARLGQFSRKVIGLFSEVACQNTASCQRFQALGAKASVLGNLKFDLAPPTDLLAEQALVQTRLKHRPFILIASTHKGEDELILSAFQRSHYANSHLPVIAPRHPERSHDISALATAQDYLPVRYSQLKANQKNEEIHPLNPQSPQHQVLIIDSLGELLPFYSLASFAVIGGSFVPHGGHNPLEAALFATPCIIGEHYFNFEALINEMQDDNAIIVSTIETLFAPDYPLTSIGQNAAAFLQRNRGAVARYAQRIVASTSR